MSAFNTILEKVTYGSFNQINDPHLTFQEQIEHLKNHISDLNVNYYLIKNIILDKSVPVSQLSNELEEKSSKFKKLLYNLNNLFITEKDRSILLSLFSRAERAYLNFNKLAFLYKWKKAKYGCTTDMYMNEISEKNKNVITVLHCNVKYLFTVQDIRKILNNSLKEGFEVYHTPIPCKNPYNNIPFNKAHLLHFYFSIKASSYNIPEIFNCYFLSNFSLKKMVTEYESNIRKEKIVNLSKMQQTFEIVDNIYDMIETYNKKHPDNKINIHGAFPKNQLISIFEPYLKYYYKSLYSLCMSSKNENTLFIDALLYNFHKFNPKFGRRVMKKNIFGKKTVFIDKHVQFSSPRNYNFNYSESHKSQVKCLAPFVKKYVEISNKKNNNCVNTTRFNNNQSVLNYPQFQIVNSDNNQQYHIQIVSNQSESSDEEDDRIFTAPFVDQVITDVSNDEGEENEDEEMETESVS